MSIDPKIPVNNFSIQTARSRSPSLKRKRWMLALLFAICLSPVILAYLSYYVFKFKGGETNYGRLVEPQRMLPDSLVGRNQKGEIVALQSLIGKWLLLSVGQSRCDIDCQQRLYYQRQIRLAQGVERDRLETIWLRTDNHTVSNKIIESSPDLRLYIVDRNALSKWLEIDSNDKIDDYLYLVDPLGNLMMRFPKSPDPGKVKRDISKLMKWSHTG